MMDNGIKPVVLSVESATMVIKAIEDSRKGAAKNMIVHGYYESLGTCINGITVDMAEEYVDYIERGEFVIPAELKERAARAIIQYRLDRA